MPTIASAPRVRPDVVEQYKAFEPPIAFRGMLEELLDSVPANYLVGLKTIVLTNQKALGRDQKRQKTWSRNHMIRLADALDWSNRATRTTSASVFLLVDNIRRSEQSGMQGIPILRYEALGTVLFHEIGHHIHAVHKPVFKQREDVAENWSKKLFVRFIRKRYGYLVPFLYPFGLIHRLLTKSAKSYPRALRQIG